MGGYSNQELERTTSFASSTSNSQGSALDRSRTTSSFATTLSDHSGTIIGGSNVQRGDSFGAKSVYSDISIPQAMNQRETSITISEGRTEGTSRSRLADIARTMEAMKAEEAMENVEQYTYTDDYEDEYETDDGLESFVDFSLLSNIVVWLRDKVSKGTHVKGSIPYPRAFTGKDIVVCMKSRTPQYQTI